MNKRRVGSAYETRAARFLEAQGLKILEQNFHCRAGEIDLIARDGREVVFVEVKYRANARQGDPAEAVSFRKQQTISRVSDYYALKHQMGEQVPRRFDVIAILGQELKHYPNAFDYCGFC